MKLRKMLIAVSLLALAGCEYRARPDELVGDYRRPDTNESLSLKADGTAIVRNLPGHPGEMMVRWSRFPKNDDSTCTWIDFEPLSSNAIEWHTCANKIIGRDIVFIGYPYGDPDSTSDFEKVKPARN